MKIDIHTHTKKTKQGDKETREIDAKKFHEIISSTDVKVVAITNHNVFDFNQYQEFQNEVGDDFQIWPGVELDILEENRRGHLLVITSPDRAEDLEKVIVSLSVGKTPDSFCISISEVIDNFDLLDPIYVAHYKGKKPDLTDEDIERIVLEISNKNRVLKEATNSISAGIFVSHGHSSIYGSDVQNWSNYQTQSQSLPDLRLPVESFEQFCLLLDKDDNAINTLLDKKQPEIITIKPFKEDSEIKLTVYDDINVFFGAKGTGKSEILSAIAKYYSDKGIKANKYESGSKKLEDIYDLTGRKLQIELKDFNIDYCGKEIDFIKKAQEADITSLSRYKQFFSNTLKNKKATKVKIKDFQKESITTVEKEVNEVKDIDDNFTKFKKYLTSENSVKKHIDQKKVNDLIASLDDILGDLKSSHTDKFIDLKVASLFNSLIRVFKTEISRKTDTPEKPDNTGFRNYALNRIEIEKAVMKTLENINKEIRYDEEYVGCLDEKGDLYCKTEILIQDGSYTDGELSPVHSAKKSTQKEFSRKLKEIASTIYTEDLFGKISEFNAIEGISTIPTVLELLMVKKYFTINGKLYTPSTGESSMILLHQELNQDKDVYILDEPEKSLGNEYISNVILPLIKEKAKAKKKVFIATHDANIAVRTLPYNSIYRYHSSTGYDTFVGNPFSNSLINILDERIKKDWKNVSMSTLEGGKNAFGERGKIYGTI